jgi:hypothetical protein
LRFHPDAGSQTSILMSESLVGFNVAATRQNAGRSLKATTGGGPPVVSPGGVNLPAATGCASVIVVFGNASDAMLSQVVAQHDGANKLIAKSSFIVSP